MAFVLSEGLVADFDSTADLYAKAKFLYREFRKTRRAGLIVKAGRIIRDFGLFFRSAVFHFLAPRRPETTEVAFVTFVGVFDTVDAYGMPIYELKRGIDQYLWPLAIEDQYLHPKICKACHALCIDDQRKTFHPLLWDEASEFTPNVLHTDHERLSQVWFAGVHSNVGGGYPDDGLSFVALNWILTEALKAELRFEPIAVKTIASSIAPFGRLYDSRSGLGVYYRFDPRHLDPPRDTQGASIPIPKIHESVILRIASGTDEYSPLNLPRCFLVVTSDIEARDDTPQQIEQNTWTYEDYVSTMQHRLDRVGNCAVASKVATTLPENRSVLAMPSDNDLSLIWDTVFWCKVTYFVTFSYTAFLATFPFLPPNFLGYFPELQRILFDWQFTLRPISNAFSPIIALLSVIAKALLPSVAASWVDGFVKYPLDIAPMISLLVLLLLLSSSLQKRTHDRAVAAWNYQWQLRRRLWLAHSIARRLRMAVASLFFATAWLWFYGYVYMRPDFFNRIAVHENFCAQQTAPGASCEFSGRFPFASRFSDIPRLDALSVSWEISGYRPTLHLFTVAAILSIPISMSWALWLLALRVRVRRSSVELPGLALTIARFF